MYRLYTHSVRAVSTQPLAHVPGKCTTHKKIPFPHGKRRMDDSVFLYISVKSDIKNADCMIGTGNDINDILMFPPAAQG
jgi:hypothetical protein